MRHHETALAAGDDLKLMYIICSALLAADDNQYNIICLA